MYNICVIGGGPGGYVAAIRAAQQGAKTCLIEKNKIGGTCLNVGCIPTKTLLQTAHFYRTCKDMEGYGIKLDSTPEIDWKQAINNKNKRVESLVLGVNGLLKSNKVDIYKGEAEFLNANEIQIDDKHILQSEKFIIATGSTPIIPSLPGLDLPGIMSSDDALSISELPSTMLIMGGGVIGVELGYLFNTLGVDVTIIEMEERILPKIDKEITDILTKTLIIQGMKIFTSSKLIKVKEGFIVTFETSDGLEERHFDSVLVVAGRKPESSIGKSIGIRTNKYAIDVNEYYQTNIPHIYAIGDVTGKSMLAHSASHQGINAVDHALNLLTNHRKQIIPSCIYTTPEIATVGITEEEAKEKYGYIKVGKFPFIASGRATSSGDNTGFVKIVADGKYHQILGVHIIGSGATEIIGEATMAIELECTAEEITNIIHAHPTMSEGIMEAAYKLLGKGIHF